jgi:hypothetical protein
LPGHSYNYKGVLDILPENISVDSLLYREETFFVNTVLGGISFYTSTCFMGGPEVFALGVPRLSVVRRLSLPWKLRDCLLWKFLDCLPGSFMSCLPGSFLDYCPKSSCMDCIIWKLLERLLRDFLTMSALEKPGLSAVDVPGLFVQEVPG